MKLGGAKSERLLAVRVEDRPPAEECRRSLEAEKGEEMNAPLEPQKEHSPAKLRDPGLTSGTIRNQTCYQAPGLWSSVGIAVGS